MSLVSVGQLEIPGLCKIHSVEEQWGGTDVCGYMKGCEIEFYMEGGFQ